jgi:hypothetical protein
MYDATEDDYAFCTDYKYPVGYWGHFWGPTDPHPVNPPLASPISFCPFGSSNYKASQTGMFRAPPMEPFGARILGQGPEDGTEPNHRFGTDLSSVGSGASMGFLLISAPNYTANVTQNPAFGADIPELPEDARAKAGAVYVLRSANFWDRFDTQLLNVPKPHQYIIKTVGSSTPPETVPMNSGLGVMRRPRYIVGPEADAQIKNVIGIPDFNQDGLDDIMIGSPDQNDGAGVVYLLYSRLVQLEGNYLLEKIALDPTDPERLNGVMIRGEAGDRMGQAIASGGDFNGDGWQDVLIGLPNYMGGRGAVLLVFGQRSLLSPEGGYTIDEMVSNGYAALLVGEYEGDLAGFNVSSAGDMDNDGRDELLIAAPGASPRFDSDHDGVDDTIGLDYDGDDEPDDLTNAGVPTDLTGAGIVYLVAGENTMIGQVSLSLVGTRDLQGFRLVGQAADDQLGGGESSLGLGARSRGLSSAGDVDGDGRGDILIGSMLADPEGKTNAGECYLLYGGFTP